MQSATSFIPKLNAGWISRFFPQERFTLSGDKLFGYTPVINQPDSDFLDNGVTCINYNSGLDPSPFAASRRAVFFENPAIIKNATNGSKPLSQYSQAECEGIITGLLGGRPGGYRMFTHGFNESGGPALDAWRLDPLTVPQQCHWIDRKLAELTTNFGDYGGHCEIGAPTEGFGNLTPVRDAYASNQAAYEFMKTASGFGDLFFTQDACLYRNGTIKTYWGGYTDAHKRIAMFLNAFLLNKKALAHKQSSAKTISFAFPGKTEFATYGQSYRHQLTDGYYETNTFPQYSDKVQVILSFISLAFLDGLFAWEDTSRRGTNPAKIKPDLIIDGQLIQGYHGTGNPARGSVVNVYTPGDNVGYAECRYGGHDAFLSGVQMFARGSAWCNDSVSFARVRKVGSSAWSTVNATVALDNYQQDVPMALLKKVGNRRDLFLVDTTQTADVTSEYEIDLDGGSVVMAADGMMPYQTLFDLNA